MRRDQRGFTRVIVLILLIVILLFIFRVDVRGYAEKAWGGYIKPFITGETYHGLGDKIKARSTLEQ